MLREQCRQATEFRQDNPTSAEVPLKMARGMFTRRVCRSNLLTRSASTAEALGPMPTGRSVTTEVPGTARSLRAATGRRRRRTAAVRRLDRKADQR